MGFRTLAIEQRSSEVWQVLGAVKTEFGKFGDVLAKTKDKLDQASKELDKTGVRSRAIERELRNVEALSGIRIHADPGEVERTCCSISSTGRPRTSSAVAIRC